MTTSFTLLMHADIWHSLQANFAGTALATFGLLFIPWALASAFFRAVRLHSPAGDRRLSARVVFLFLLFGRWGIVVIWQLVSPPELFDPLCIGFGALCGT